MDGVGVALQIETANQSPALVSGQDPMQTRWVINTTVRDKFVEGSKAGFPELYFGRWQQVSHFTTPEEVHSTDDDPGLPRERPVTKTALSAERYLDSVLGGKTEFGQPDPQRSDFGLRFGFYGEDDIAKMAVVSATLLPSLPEIRQIARNYNLPSPIGDMCEGQDTADFGDRQTCPTCWAKWIESAVCSKFMLDVATNGRQVTVTDIISNQADSRTIIPQMHELKTGRGLIVESLRRGILANQKTWTDVANEMEQGKVRQAVDVYQNNIRKDLHAAKPQDAQMMQVREYAKAVGQNQAPVSNDPTAGMSTVEKANYYADLAAFEQFRSNKVVVGDKVVMADVTFPEFNGEFSAGQAVLCEGLPGVIAEVKSGGWFLIDLDGPHEPRTVRKDKLQVR